MRKKLLNWLCVVCIIAFTADLSHADCFLNCVLSPGNVCINGECVPKTSPVPTPTPSQTISEIRLESKPASQIVAQNIDCSKLDLKNLKIYLTRKTPPPAVSFYSDIIDFRIAADGSVLTDYWFAQKDILNRYVFLLLAENETPKSQFTGQDFVFNVWENKAFNDVIQSMTCAELKSSGLYFNYGVSIKGDRSDFEGNTFTFQ